MVKQIIDSDPIETQEWLDALHSMLREEGTERAAYVLAQVNRRASEAGVELPTGRNTPYQTTPCHPKRVIL